MRAKVDIVEIHNRIKFVEDTITNGTIQEVIDFAKEYDIHQDSTNEYYLSNVEKIKARLAENNIDWETI